MLMSTWALYLHVILTPSKYLRVQVGDIVGAQCRKSQG